MVFVRIFFMVASILVGWKLNDQPGICLLVLSSRFRYFSCLCLHPSFGCMSLRINFAIYERNRTF